MSLQTIIKVATGIFIVPLAILANRLWPWWTAAPIQFKIITAIVVLPITAIAFAVSFWWNEF